MIYNANRFIIPCLPIPVIFLCNTITQFLPT
nr:MAG TPA: hypothetical protein [Caudoviricetes sp.]